MNRCSLGCLASLLLLLCVSVLASSSSVHLRRSDVSIEPANCPHPQSEFFISLPLTILGYVPGIIYSVYVILKTPPELPSIDGERPYYILA
ncbi:hypothetical protein TRIUR3_09669 [Triticum urartu]|uniref:Uncharacterized protein n=2 Tax=Triticum TaxID=4564 RepID=A0A9R0ZPA7_TRITD|nr:hypothetical protein TRIUR3_09669 [Triticum urartu]VAI80756.1 unnamed protein product [Triticum turgidum subsp. durum]